MQPSEWQNIGTAIAATCGHEYPIQSATNDRGEQVTRHDAYPDPNVSNSQYDANELCYDCYIAAMEPKVANMTMKQFNAAWLPRT